MPLGPLQILGPLMFGTFRFSNSWETSEMPVDGLSSLRRLLGRMTALSFFNWEENEPVFSWMDLKW